MNPSKYIRTERGNAIRLATALGVGISYVSQLTSGHRAVSPARAVQIELFSDGVVTRKDLRPNDWHLIWPELNKPEQTVSLEASRQEVNFLRK